MQEWLNYWNFIFWFVLLGFIFNHVNFISLLFFSEIMWLVLYCLAILLGAINDDINLVSITFLILGIAGLEFSFGFLLLLLFKLTNTSFVLTKNDKINRKTSMDILSKLILNQIKDSWKGLKN